MIEARAELDAEGRLVRFEASGHAGHGRKGQDIVCAAFTVLARTAYETLAALPGSAVEGSASGPGTLRFAVRRIDEGGLERAAGIADFLLAGLSGLEREFPGEVSVTIDRHWRE